MGRVSTRLSPAQRWALEEVTLPPQVLVSPGEIELDTWFPMW